MHPYLHVIGMELPLYGMMILLGILVANIVAFKVSKRFETNYFDVVLLEIYGIIGAFIGSKALYLIISYKDIEWSRITEFKYFSNILANGFVFYGGLALAIVFILLGGKIHKLKTFSILRKFIFMIPIMHAFGRVGCFFAGCCYGRPYKGFGAVTFPEGSQGPSGVSLFPVQLVEAVIVLIIAIVLLWLQIKKDFYYTIETYLLAYSVVRFILEFFRYDAIRGEAFGLSTSQWISIVVFIGTVVSIIYRKKNVSEER